MKKLHHHLCKKSRHYARWHQHPYHSHLHWLTFLLAFLLSASALAGVWDTTEREQDQLVYQFVRVQLARAQNDCTFFVSPSQSLSNAVNSLNVV